MKATYTYKFSQQEIMEILQQHVVKNHPEHKGKMARCHLYAEPTSHWGGEGTFAAEIEIEK